MKKLERQRKNYQVKMASLIISGGTHQGMQECFERFEREHKEKKLEPTKEEDILEELKIRGRKFYDKYKEKTK